jgi:uncharacterized protein (TIGR03437 family)
MKTNSSLLVAVVLLFGACAWPSFAQPAFDSSGNGQLNGNYYLRQVFYFVADDSGELGEAMNVQGEITFSGAGTYTFTGAILDSAASTFPTPQNFTANGTYVVSASGEGYLSAVNPDFPNDRIIGLVSHGVFIGSSTENSNGYNDLFIAAPIGSTPATNATLNGSYQTAYFDPTFPGDALFTLNANGSGTVGTVNATGYIPTTSDPTASTSSTETLTGVTYSFANGGAQLNFGGSSSSLIFGTEVLYVTPDGNFIFGGSANGFDIFAGVRAATSNPSNYDGLYYQAGLDFNQGYVVSDSVQVLDSYFGSVQDFSENIIAHQRLNSLLEYDGSSDFTYYDNYTLNGNGSSFDSTYNYWSSTDGTIRIGSGPGPFLGINIGFQGPSLSGSGVYLNPAGVVNAASSAPFTAFVSPGEFITLYGTGLAPSTATAASLPISNKLNGVQVMINDIAAPVQYVSPTQVSVIVPFDTVPGSVAQIQVINNGANSNIVTQFTGLTSAGVFTYNPESGIGYAAAQRPDGSEISDSNPALIGETEAVYVAGMGAVSPPVSDGAAAGGGASVSNTTTTPSVFLYDSAGNSAQATVAFSGLAPGFAGLYQINFTVPTGLAADSDTVEAAFPIGGTVAASRSANERPHLHRHRPVARNLRFSARSQSSVDWRNR